MHDSKLLLGKWALGIYLMVTNLEGVPSLKLHRDLRITQNTHGTSLPAAQPAAIEYHRPSSTMPPISGADENLPEAA